MSMVKQSSNLRRKAALFAAAFFETVWVYFTKAKKASQQLLQVKPKLES